MPDWIYIRPHISKSVLKPSFERTVVQAQNYLVKASEKKTLGAYVYQVQQVYLIEDLLYCMMSIEGTYIKRRVDAFNKEVYEYVIEPNLDQPTCDLSL